MLDNLVYMFCFNSLVVLILNFFKIKATFNRVLLVYFVVFIIYMYLKKPKKWKKPINLKIDYMVIFIVFTTLVIFYKLYSKDIYINYASTDSATHLMMAKQFLNYKTIFHNNVPGYPFLAYTNIALLYIIKNIPIYKYFIIMNMIVFTIGILLFYKLLLLATKDKIVSAIGTFLYIFGFNLSILTFGFTSQVFSIPIIILLIREIYIFTTEEKEVNFLISLKIFLLLFGIQVSYYYFTPQIVLAFMIIAFILFREKEMIKSRYFNYGLFVYLSFSILYNWYTSQKVAEGYKNLLAMEGFVYKDLYSSFIPLIPLSIYFIYKKIKYKKWDVILILLSTSVLFSIILLILCIKGYASSYYYYKNYPYLSILLILSSCISLVEIKKQNTDLYKSLFISGIFFLGMFLRVDEYIHEKNSKLNPEVLSKRNSVYLEIFYRLKFQEYVFDSEEMELINYIIRNKSKYTKHYEDSERLPIISDNKQFTWFKEITDIWPSMNSKGKYYFEMIDLNKFDQNSEFEYIIFFPRMVKDWKEENKEQLMKYKVIYQIGENKILKK